MKGELKEIAKGVGDLMLAGVTLWSDIISTVINSCHDSIKQTKEDDK